MPPRRCRKLRARDVGSLDRRVHYGQFGGSGIAEDVAHALAAQHFEQKGGARVSREDYEGAGKSSCLYEGAHVNAPGS
jgi:hypothetical protein